MKLYCVATSNEKLQFVGINHGLEDERNLKTMLQRLTIEERHEDCWMWIHIHMVVRNERTFGFDFK